MASFTCCQSVAKSSHAKPTKPRRIPAAPQRRNPRLKGVRRSASSAMYSNCADQLAMGGRSSPSDGPPGGDLAACAMASEWLDHRSKTPDPLETLREFSFAPQESPWYAHRRFP